MIEVTLPDMSRLDRDLRVSGKAVEQSVQREIKAIAVDLVAKVKGEKLSGQVLNVRTGRLRRSINQKVIQTATGIEAKVGTKVFYGASHENGKRPFLKPSLREMQPEIDRRIQRAVANGVINGARRG